MCARWVRFFRNGGAPTYRALASACSPAYSQLGFRVHPPTPPGFSCSLLPFAFAVPHLNKHIAQPSTAEMDWCQVVGPRGFPLNNPHLAPCKGRSKWQTIAGRLGRQAGRAGAGHRAAQGSRGQQRAAEGSRGQQRAAEGSRGQQRAAEGTGGTGHRAQRTGHRAQGTGQGRAGQGRAGPGFTLPHRLVEARPGASVGASSAHANGQRRSRQFRGLGFRV